MRSAVPAPRSGANRAVDDVPAAEPQLVYGHSKRPVFPFSTVRLEKSLVPQPVGAGSRQGGARRADLAHSEAVTPGSVDVQLRLGAGALQGQVHDDTVLHL